MKKTIIHALLLTLLAMGGLLTGCVEHRYVREHHQHSPEYNHRHHRDHVEVDIHN